MCRFLTLVTFYLFCYKSIGQNYLLEMFHPLSKQGVALQTDSMFIRSIGENGKEDRRESGYTYNKGKLAEIREIRHEDNGQFINSTKQSFNIDKPENPIAHTVRFDSILKSSYEYRKVYFAKNPGVTDSFYLEALNGTEWVRSQKSTYKYHPSGLLQEQADYVPGDSPEKWELRSQTTHDYDTKGRVKQRTSNYWKSQDESFQNIYNYRYKDADKPWTENSYFGPIGKTQPIDSTVYWFDAEGKYDSAHHYTWVAQHTTGHF